MSERDPESAPQSTGPLTGIDLPTYFAPPDRASRDEIEDGVRALAQNQILRGILESIHIPVMVLNAQRQILAANATVLAAMGIDDPQAVTGQRPGEGVGCEHAWDEPGGCGTSRHCATCGAGQAIFTSQIEGRMVERDCQLLTADGDALEFAVRATPIAVGDREFTVLAFRDVSSELRREVLEQTFFHDVLNTIGGLHGWSEVLRRGVGDKSVVIGGKIAGLVDQLTREILDQRDLLAAEAGAFDVELQELSIHQIFHDLEVRFEGHDLCRDRTLEIVSGTREKVISTDSTIVMRVVGNMVKNALEATPAGGTVRVTTMDLPEGGVRFTVWNAGRIPDEIALQIFRRSFTTKGGKGRGLGTYSMKLFGERYLAGVVRFETGEAGTTFTLDLPHAGVNAGR